MATDEIHVYQLLEAVRQQALQGIAIHELQCRYVRLEECLTQIEDRLSQINGSST